MKFDPVMLRIYNDKQLFIDDLLIESCENIRRKWHKPEKYDKNPVIFPDKPWEHVLELTVNGFQIIYDHEYKLFRLWYLDTNCTEVNKNQSTLGNSTFSMLYAESEDGTKWTKPECGVILDGVKTNVVIENGYNLTCVKDPHEKDKTKRFKGIYTPHQKFGDIDKVLSIVSEEGIIWKVGCEKPVFGRCAGHQDDVAVMSYDPFGRLFILNMRHYDMYAIKSNFKNPVVGLFTPPYYPLDWKRMAKRRIWQTRSSDAIHWSEPHCILTPEDGLDALDEAYYGLSQYRVGSLLIGFLTSLNYTDNTLGVRIVYSRNDGTEWEHLNNRNLFLERGSSGSWDEFMTTMPSPCIEFNDQLLFFYGGAINHHDWWLTGAREEIDAPEAYDRNKVKYSLGFAKLRMDGFASLEATVRSGILITRHFISDGTYLSLNAKCELGGTVSAEIVDAYDNVIPNYAKEDCDVFTGDNINHIFSWRGRNQLPDINMDRPSYPERERSRLRKIRFYIYKAGIYSFALKSSV